jgi:glycosyltransferase involved in cell wall biosynthesis
MSERSVKVSVLMLAYNHERFIGEAIEGVLMQKTAFPL